MLTLNLLDAGGGSAAAAASVILFYPLEVIRVSMQLQLEHIPNTNSLPNGHESRISEEQCTHSSIHSFVDRVKGALRYFVSYLKSLSLLIKQLASHVSADTISSVLLNARITFLRQFKGMLLRTLHTLATSFVYYHFYGVLTRWKAQGRLFVNSSSFRSPLHQNLIQTSVWDNLVSSTCAAMLTVILALPLDSLVLHAQADSANIIATVDSSEAPSRGPTSALEVLTSGNIITHLKRWYQGLLPALLLCANPVIHFTLYDFIKLRILNRGMESNQASHPTPTLAKNVQLSATQAFIIGLFAKACATIATFPLLRAKLLMMLLKDEPMASEIERVVTSDSKELGLNCTSTQSRNAGIVQETTGIIATVSPAENQTPNEHSLGLNFATNEMPAITISGPSNITEASAPASVIMHLTKQSSFAKLWRIMAYLYQTYGLSQGLYKGLWVHMLHTSLRTATSMTLKEFFVETLRKAYLL